MTIIYAEEFVKQFRRLPASAQRIFRLQERRFRTNWHDPRLHVKRLINYPLPFSFRITRNYRVLFILVATIRHCLPPSVTVKRFIAKIYRKVVHSPNPEKRSELGNGGERGCEQACPLSSRSPLGYLERP